jgi:glycosyltransferase involved in cell wall biosynthesis
MKPKIAFIVSKFPCYDETFILREMDALSRKMDIIIFSLKSSKEKIIHDEAKALLSKTICIPYFFSWEVQGALMGMMFRHPVRYWRAFFRLVFGNLKSPEFLLKNLAFFPKSVYLAQWALKSNITLMHAYWATYPTTVALVASELTKIPFSFTGHAHDIYANTTHLKEKMMRASFVTTCTRQNKTHLIKVAPRFPEQRIMVNHHGLHLEKFEVNGKNRNSTFQILSVGTLHDYKGFQYLIPALGLLRDKGLHFECTIVGGGPLESDLRKHIRLLNLEPYVKMTGPLKQDEVLPFFKRSDLFVLVCQPERHWGIPNVLVEALATKTAVITTRFGSSEELIQDGETGLMVPPQDPEVLAGAIERLYQDDALRTRLAEAGRRIVFERFDLKKNVNLFAQRLEHHENAALLA